MTMQNCSTPPSRNVIKAAGPAMQTKIGLPAPHASTVKANGGQTTNGHLPGPAVKGFSGSGVKSGKV